MQKLQLFTTGQLILILVGGQAGKIDEICQDASSGNIKIKTKGKCKFVSLRFIDSNLFLFRPQTDATSY